MLGDARGALVIAQIRLNGLKDALIKRLWDRLYFSCQRLEKKIEDREDSLASVALTILRDKGVMEASEYVDSTLRKAQLPSDKIAKVNFAILEKAVSRKQVDTSALGREIVSVVETPKDTASPMGDILAAAREKAKNPPDSAQPSLIHMTYTERVRVRNLQLAREGRQQREEQLARENRDKADRILVEIYALIDGKKSKEATKGFMEQKSFLKENLPEAAYTKLNAAVAAIAKDK